MENGALAEIVARVATLRKEQNEEIMYTLEGHRIPLKDLVSLNGLSWS